MFSKNSYKLIKLLKGALFERGLFSFIGFFSTIQFNFSHSSLHPTIDGWDIRVPFLQPC
jgi:hypothetical protein